MLTLSSLMLWQPTSFPPSEVEFKLRYLMTLDPDARKKYMNGRFIQAIKMVDDNF